MHRQIWCAVLCVSLLGLIFPGSATVLGKSAPQQAEPAGNPAQLGGAGEAFDAFQRTHHRTDLPVAVGEALRTWIWGPEAFTDVLDEPYGVVYSPNVLPGKSRSVQYFDKARMEINDPTADPNSVWYVTNGLLVMEMITGQMQIGDDHFLSLDSAQVNVAGDAGDPDGPTYATFAGLLDAPAHPPGEAVTARVDRAGNVTSDEALASNGVEAALVDDVTGHAIVAPFWEFMNSSGAIWDGQQFTLEQLFENPYFATGRPVTEAYWASVEVGGTGRDVLMQCFERRCLTYTPGNPEGFVVEAGNVGRHYYNWRYGSPSLATDLDGKLLSTDGDRLQVIEHNSTTTLLEAPEGMEIIDPVWSPDGSRIAYVLGEANAGGALHVVHADGTNDQTLIPAGDIRHPSWSPDGQQLVFASGEEGDTIETINIDGTGRSVIGAGLRPSWSPQGDRIAFIAEQPNDELLMVFEVLSTMNPDGSDVVEVVSRPPDALPAYGGIDMFAWSPDGTQFVYGAEYRLSLPPFTTYDLYRVNADGSDNQAISPGYEAGPRIGWTPDGSRLTFSRQHVIYTVNPDGTDTRGLAWDFSAPISDYDWFGSSQ